MAPINHGPIKHKRKDVFTACSISANICSSLPGYTVLASCIWLSQCSQRDREIQGEVMPTTSGLALKHPAFPSTTLCPETPL